MGIAFLILFSLLTICSCFLKNILPFLVDVPSVVKLLVVYEDIRFRKPGLRWLQKLIVKLNFLSVQNPLYFLLPKHFEGSMGIFLIRWVLSRLIHGLVAILRLEHSLILNRFVRGIVCRFVLQFLNADNSLRTLVFNPSYF